MRQWQCPCGAWVDMAQLKHVHYVTTRELTLEEMTKLRWLGRDGEALAGTAEVTYATWHPDYPRRDKPND